MISRTTPGSSSPSGDAAPSRACSAIPTASRRAAVCPSRPNATAQTPDPSCRAGHPGVSALAPGTDVEWDILQRRTRGWAGCVRACRAWVRAPDAVSHTWALHDIRRVQGQQLASGVGGAVKGGGGGGGAPTLTDPSPLPEASAVLCSANASAVTNERCPSTAQRVSTSPYAPQLHPSAL